MLGKQIIETAISKNSDINAGGGGSHFKSMQVILLFIKTKKKKKLMYATFNFFFNLMVE
jgi:hypothetical protein